MGWWESYFSAFSQYADFEGRTARGVFWRFFGLNAVISLALFLSAFVASAVSASNAPYYAEPDLPAASAVFLALGALYLLVALIPGLAITARRLHDVGRSGWWQLLGLIGMIGAIVVWVMCAGESKGSNQWGASAAGSGLPAPTAATVLAPPFSVTQSSSSATSGSSSPSGLDAVLTAGASSPPPVAPDLPASPSSRLDEVLGGDRPSPESGQGETPSSSGEPPTADQAAPPSGAAPDSAHADLRAMIDKRTGSE